jgi:16S rRNA (guanine527-N7)-methyltransferase
VQFENELAGVLPADLPNRPEVIRLSARHLDLIVAANRNFNLTRITGAREAAIKHVLDSVLPWRLFQSSPTVLDAGTGAGFPGIPLALVLPSVRFLLSESVGKKARFVADVVKELGLSNIQVQNARAEEILRSVHVEAIAARAVAPVARAAALFGPALRKGVRALLYKGPDAAAEIAEASQELRRWQVGGAIVDTYDLPDGLGRRTIVELKIR